MLAACSMWVDGLDIESEYLHSAVPGDLTRTIGAELLPEAGGVAVFKVDAPAMQVVVWAYLLPEAGVATTTVVF